MATPAEQIMDRLTTLTKVEGIDYSPEGIQEIREALISLRDGAMEQGAMEWVLVLSHAIAQLAWAMEVSRHVGQGT